MMETQNERGKREQLLEELKREIQKGIDSGPATPLYIEEIKRKGRQRRAARCADRHFEEHESKLTALRQVLKEGEESGRADYALKGLLGELDSESGVG